MEILVFKTSINSYSDIQNIAKSLNNHPQIQEWSVDLDDYERVLRIKAMDRSSKLGIAECIRAFGFDCEDLDH
ncbi:MAG: hypothetical protein RLO12_17395 [Fulvivirga sp.]